jgi:hypothetical protein
LLVTDGEPASLPTEVFAELSAIRNHFLTFSRL